MRDGTQRNSVSERVVVAVADAEDVDPRDLDPPLATVVDPDALAHLFTDATVPGHVTFEYSGYEVTVENGGSVTLHAIEHSVATD